MAFKMRKGFCEHCGVVDRETALYTAAGPVDIVEDELSPIGFVVVPVQELCPICATLEGVAAPEVADKVREYTDLMKVSVELPSQVGLVGPSTRPVAPEPLDDILVDRESELEGRFAHLIGTTAATTTTVAPSATIEEEEIVTGEEEGGEIPEGTKKEELLRLMRKLRRLLMER